MERFRKGILWKVGLGLLLVLLIGPLEQADSQVLRYACSFSDSKSLDPHRAVGAPDRIICEQLFNGLVRYKPGNSTAGAIEPELAKSIPIPETLANGSQQWIFQLREGVMFHPYDGKPGYELTSEDVVYSLRRAANSDKSAFSADYLAMAFEAVDKYTVKITLKKPISPFLLLPKLANRQGGLIVSKKALVEKGDEWFKNHPVGAGPFMFSSYKPMEKVVIVRNPNYYRGAPRLERYELFYVPNLSSRELALQKGEIDAIEGVREYAWYKKLSKFPNLAVDIVGTDETFVVHFNMSVKPLNLLKVRQAIAYALSRKEFLSYYGEEVSEPIYSAVHSRLMVGGLTREEVEKENLLFDCNVTKAKELLVESGYPNGFSLSVFTSELDEYRRQYELIQAQLRKVGINLNLSVVDHSTFHTRIRQNLNPIVVYSCSRPSPDMILTHFYHSASIVATGEKPITNFSHIGALDSDGDGVVDSIDDLILAARWETDPRKQVELWKEAQKKILKWMVAYPIFSAGTLFARKSYVDWGYEKIAVNDGLKASEKTQLKR